MPIYFQFCKHFKLSSLDRLKKKKFKLKMNEKEINRGNQSNQNLDFGKDQLNQ